MRLFSLSHPKTRSTMSRRLYVVVGSHDRRVEPVNAAILDRNAKKLSRIPRVRVVRVPMPSNIDGTWRTLTNVVFTIGVVLVPSYVGAEQEERQAVAIYERLLPNWRVVRINVDRLIAGCVALHCVGMNLVSVGSLGAPSSDPSLHAFGDTGETILPSAR